MGFMGAADFNPVPGDSIHQIDDPITAAQARELLGVSKEKMSQLLKGKLQWRPSDVDERMKLVSKAAVLELKKDLPTRAASQKPMKQEGSPEERKRGRQRPQEGQPAPHQEIYLSEWMSKQGIDTARALATRSQQAAATMQAAPITASMERGAILRSKPVSLPTIRRIMAGVQHPLPVTAERLAAALGITIEQLGQHPPA